MEQWFRLGIARTRRRWQSRKFHLLNIRHTARYSSIVLFRRNKYVIFCWQGLFFCYTFILHITQISISLHIYFFCRFSGSRIVSVFVLSFRMGRTLKSLPPVQLELCAKYKSYASQKSDVINITILYYPRHLFREPCVKCGFCSPSRMKTSLT